jgi:Tfp pilus assembly protein PilN
MIQQINLYQQDDSETLILANPYVLAILSTCLLFVIITVFSLFSLQHKQDAQKLLQAQLNEVQAHLQQLQAQYPKQQIDTVLDKELQETRGYYQNLSQILEMLADNKSDRSLGFSRYLLALANQADSNVWLTAISIDSETESMSLKGSTFKPEQVPLLLQRLQHTSAFKGRHFARLSVEQSTLSPEQVDFKVSSSLKAEKEESHAGKP